MWTFSWFRTVRGANTLFLFLQAIYFWRKVLKDLLGTCAEKKIEKVQLVFRQLAALTAGTRGIADSYWSQACQEDCSSFSGSLRRASDRSQAFQEDCFKKGGVSRINLPLRSAKLIEGPLVCSNFMLEHWKLINNGTCNFVTAQCTRKQIGKSTTCELHYILRHCRFSTKGAIAWNKWLLENKGLLEKNQHFCLSILRWIFGRLYSLRPCMDQ